MESVGKLHCVNHQPLYLSLNNHRRSSISSLAFQIPLPPSCSTIKHSISARLSSSSPTSPTPLYKIPNTSKHSILKTTGLAIATAAAIFFMRLQHKHAIAVPVPTPTVETSTTSTDVEEKEKDLEERLSSNPDDIESLQSLMEIKIKSHKLVEVIQILDRLIELEPNEEEWPLLKAHIFSYKGDNEEATKEFEEILAKDPFRVEAYHGLVMACSESGGKLDLVVKRIEAVMERCRKENKTSDLRDFKLLLAQIKLIDGSYMEALKVYEQLVKEEPRDFRPYLCQGIIYSLLKKKDEAEKQFDKFRKLVPKNHPYKEYFFDNVLATKFFSEKAEREGAALNN